MSIEPNERFGLETENGYTGYRDPSTLRDPVCARCSKSPETCNCYPPECPGVFVERRAPSDGGRDDGPLPDDIERWEDGQRLCAVCEKPVRVAELCADCAKGNDPFPEMADR
jgi:hypothetical protein